MDEETYVCAICKETFTKGWTEEEALAELEKNFPGVPPEHCSVACEGCWQAMAKMGFE